VVRELRSRRRARASIRAVVHGGRRARRAIARGRLLPVADPALPRVRRPSRSRPARARRRYACRAARAGGESRRGAHLVSRSRGPRLDLRDPVSQVDADARHVARRRGARVAFERGARVELRPALSPAAPSRPAPARR
jgi:hypothetical protein